MKKYEDTIKRTPSSGKPSKVTGEIKSIIADEQMKDDETRSKQSGLLGLCSIEMIAILTDESTIQEILLQ